MYEKILVPLDGSKLGEAAVPFVEELVIRLCPDVKVEVTLLQVIPQITYLATGSFGGSAILDSSQMPYTAAEMEKQKKQVLDYLDKAGVPLKNKGAVISSVVEVGDAAEEILKVSDRIKADLIAISTHGRSGISRWALGSVADKVLRHGNTPVLMIRAAKKQ